MIPLRCFMVVYIRKVKKSESKSQLKGSSCPTIVRLCISVKLKNLKANHNAEWWMLFRRLGCVYP